MAEQFKLDLEDVVKSINTIAAIGATIEHDIKTMNEITALVYTPQNMASKTISKLKQYYEENLVAQADRTRKSIEEAQANLNKYLATVKANLDMD